MSTCNNYYTLKDIRESGEKIVLMSRGSYIETKKYFKHYCYFGILESRHEILKDRKYSLKSTYYDIPFSSILLIFVPLIILSITLYG